MSVLIIFAAFAWNYNQHGADWAGQGYTYCDGRPVPERLFNPYQSPVDIHTEEAYAPVSEPPVFSNCRTCKLPSRKIDGHTWEVVYNSSLCAKCFAAEFGGVQYHLHQYHLHSGSEHTLDGARSAMELHLVHDDESTHGVYDMVVAIRLELAANGTIPDLNATSLASLPADPYSFFLERLLRGKRQAEYYTMLGSMTTPDCKSDVRWLVFEHSLTISPAMLEHFIMAIGPDRTDGVTSQATAACPDLPHNQYCTYRSTQPLNGREIRKGRAVAWRASSQGVADAAAK
jgi:carbonic anhydrase